MIVIYSAEDLCVGSKVLTLGCVPEPMGWLLHPILLEPTSGIVDLGWGSGLCTSNKCSGDAIAADQESNFENDCVHLSSFLKEQLV